MTGGTDAEYGKVKLAADGLTSSGDLAALSVGTAEIAADAITGAKIADDAIDSEHYVDGSIDTAHIANLQVTTGKIAADAIDGTKLADNAVDSEHITAGSIDTAHIADVQVTNGKIADTTIQSGKASIFKSTEQTGTGSSQNVAHGLARTPAFVLIIPTELTGGAYDVAEGAHDGTNVVVTVTSGEKFIAVAW